MNFQFVCSPPGIAMVMLLALGIVPVPAIAQNPARSNTDVAASAAVDNITLTLDEVIGIALRQHGDVDAAKQNYYGAVEGITSARSSLYPQITADFNYNYRNGRREMTNNFSSSFDSSDFSSGISITQNIFDGGRIHATVKQAKSAALGAMGSVGMVRNNISYTVASNFYEQLRQEKLVAQRRSEVELASRQLAMIEAQVAAGMAARSDVQSVQVNLSQAKFNLVTAQNNLLVAQTKLRQSMGLKRGVALHLQEPALAQTVAPAAPQGEAESTFSLPPLPPLPDVPPLKSLDQYLEQALRLRPDLLQAEANVEQNEARLRLAKVARRPQISVSAGYNLDPFEPQNRGFTFGAGVSIPIFDGGGRKADVRAAKHRQNASEINLGQLQEDVVADVQIAYVDVSGEMQRIINARALVQAARTNFQTASEKYQLGLGIVLDVVNAQTQLFSAQTSLTQALYDYQLALANLDRAVGRFAWTNPGMAPPERLPEIGDLEN